MPTDRKRSDDEAASSLSSLPLTTADPDAVLPDDAAQTTVEAPPLVAGRLLTGPVPATVFWLALPVLGEQVLNACVTWNDAILAGRISAEATGAVGIAGYLGWLMTMLFWMVDTGASAIVARSIGAGRPDEARRTANQAFLLALGMGLVATGFVMITAPVFVRLLNMSGPAADIAVHFMRIDAIGYLGAAVSFALAACLRGAGDTRTPLVILGGVNAVNFIASWLLTFGVGPLHGYGVGGIATGTVIARWVGAFCIVGLLSRAARRGTGSAARRAIRLDGSWIKLNRPLVARILRIGLPAAADGALTFGGHFLFMTIVTRVPTAFPRAVLYAAHIVGIRIESLSYLPANAWSVAAATMVGQNLGARHPQRAEQAARAAARQAALLLSATMLLYFFAAGPLFRILSNDPQVWQCGVPALKGLAFVQVPLAFLIVYLGALRGAGDTRVPMLFTVLGMGCVRLPFAAIGGFLLGGGLLGAWSGMFADLLVRSVLVTLRFRSGRWKTIRV